MKKYFSLLLLFAVSLTAFAQAPDTLTPEKNARFKIGRIRDNSVRAITPADFRRAFTDITNMAVSRTLNISMKDLRAGKADTATVVSITDSGKSGIFVLDKTDTTTPDDSSMAVIVGARRYKRSYEGVLNITWFGAVGDGVSDNTAAFDRAMAFVSRPGVTRGHTLFIPSGVFMTRKVTIAPRLTIQGAGRGVSIVKLMANQNTDVMFIPKESFLVTIKDFTIDGNRENNTVSGNGLAVELQALYTPFSKDVSRDKVYTGNNSYKYLNIMDMDFVYSIGNGLYIPGTNYIINVDRIYCYKNSIGFYNASTDNMFSNVVCEKNYTLGIRESGSNNKWTGIKVVYCGESKTGRYGGILALNGARSSFMNVEGQENFGAGMIVENYRSLMATNVIMDANGYLNLNVQTSDQVSPGYRFLGMSNSTFINCKATNFKAGTGVRPHVQTFAYSEDINCFGNDLKGISVEDQEKANRGISQSYQRLSTIISRRTAPVTSGGTTYEADQPVIEQGVRTSNFERIELPAVIPYRNVISYVLSFVHLGTTPGADSARILRSSDSKLSLEYISTGVKHLRASIQTPLGLYSVNLNDSLIVGKTYRVFFQLKRINDNFARVDIRLSYQNADAGIILLKANSNYTTTGQIFDAIGNVYFNDYAAAPVGNINLRLIQFAVFGKEIPEHYANIGQTYDANEAILLTDFENTSTTADNVIKSGVLPAPGAYYLNKTFITDNGLYLGVKAGSVHSFVNLNHTGAGYLTSNLSTSLTFSAANTHNIGTLAAPAANIWAYQYLAPVSMSIGTRSTAGTFQLQFGAADKVALGLFTGTGQLYVQTPGIQPTNTGETMQVYGTSKTTGLAKYGADIELTANGTGVYLRSPDGTRYKITVPNGGGSITVTAAP